MGYTIREGSTRIYVQPGMRTIRATGGGANSSLTIQGSTIQSEDTTTLAADNQVQLLAAANTATQTSDQKSSSGSVGVTLGKNTGVTVSASQGSGDGNGQDVDYTNTQVQGGKVVNIQSGGDTTLKGAVVKADAVNATVGGNLTIESLQDSSRYKESSQNASGSVTLGAGAGGSVSAGATNINSNYLSVTEQSGIKTGDGGFNVQVQGNTDLKGGAMTSTQAAIDKNKTALITAKLTTSDLQNSASYSAESYQVSVGTSGGSAGAGQDSGKASSTTTSGISGVAGNKNARTGDQETGIKNIFDADKVSKEVNAQTAITSEFGKQASEAVESYSSAQRKVLQDQLKQAKTPEDKEKAQQAIKDVNTQERALNILVGAVSGLGVSSVTKEALATAADEMRELMVEDSKKFAGVVDSTDKVLSNNSGESVGVNGDGTKLGGTRVDLDILCGVDNSRCTFEKKTDGSVDTSKPVSFKGPDVKRSDGTTSPQTIAEFLATPEGQKMSGPTGGIQGEKGTLFGVPYTAGSWQDKLIESFAGPHDMIGGKFSGLYDGQGNAERGRSELTTTLQNRWSEVAVLPSAPFAAAQSLPPEVWKAIAILLGAGK